MQEGETHDQEAVAWSVGDKRMMEIPAASNVWWYVEVVQALPVQLQVAYPGGPQHSAPAVPAEGLYVCRCHTYRYLCIYVSRPEA